MTDRIAAFVVTLEHDIREDDVEPIVNAIRCLRGVLSVSTVVADVELHIAEERARRELGKKLWDVLDPTKAGTDRQ